MTKISLRRIQHYIPLFCTVLCRTVVIFILVLCFFSLRASSKKTVFFVVHGTWGADASWYMPGGDFFDVLEKSAYAHNGVVVPFRWSGKTHPTERSKAAQQLAKIIQTYDDSDVAIVVIGHSHGGTIGILASHLITRQIDVLFVLGTPVNKDQYPHMGHIQYFYNLFSLEDMIQTVGGLFGREYYTNDRVANIRIFFNNDEPGHTELHHPCLAQWLPTLHEHFLDTICGGNMDIFSQPGLLYFTYNVPPVYKRDFNRQELIARDERLSILMVDSMRTKRA